MAKWRKSQDDIQGEMCDVYSTGLPSGMYIQVANWLGDWVGFVYADTCRVYLIFEALEKTPPHTSPDDCKRDILKRVDNMLREDLEALSNIQKP